MKKHIRNQSIRLRQVLYYAAIVVLISLSIYQVYSIQENLEDTVHDAETAKEKASVISSSLLTPHEMYITTGHENGYVKVEATSGYYPVLTEQSRLFMEEAAERSREVQEISQMELPEDRVVIAMRYAYMLEHVAVRELLSLEIEEDQWVQEIWLQPAMSDQEPARLYLINWQTEQYMQLESDISWNDTVNQSLCQSIYSVTDVLDAQYWAAWKSFPDVFQGGCYYMQQESDIIVYEAALEAAYDPYNAEKYVKHFFSYPETAKPIGDSGTSVWYADERQTVRLDEDGFLQYVQTPERTQEKTTSLTEAYRIAASFLKEDLEWDAMRLLEIYLCKYEINEGSYTFYWNYKLDNVILQMDPERQEDWNLPYPIKITVENGIVRYYHRYLVNKVMEADRFYKVPVSYMKAIEKCREMGVYGVIEAMELGYIESGEQLEMCWMLQIQGDWYRIPMGGGV